MIGLLKETGESVGVEMGGQGLDRLYKTPRGAPKELEPFWEIWARLFETAYQEGQTINADAIAEAAIVRMLEEIDDPYTKYIPPKIYETSKTQFQGQYEGIGAEIYKRGDSFLLNPLPNSPAESAGLKPGDTLVTVDGQSIIGWTLYETVNRVRGRKGTMITLGIRHLGSEDVRQIVVLRGLIMIDSVHWNMTNDNIAYVRLRAFYGNSDEALEEVLKKIATQNARGLVLDLRDNPGGYLTTVSNITSHFLDTGLIAYEKEVNGKRTDWKVAKGGLAGSIPMVVLVNEFSASASEVLAGALQDHGRAPIIGTNTLGKGSVNKIIDLTNGGGLAYTYSRWYTPNGRQIEGKGLQPDILVLGEPTHVQAQGDRQLERALHEIEKEISLSTNSIKTTK